MPLAKGINSDQSLSEILSMGLSGHEPLQEERSMFVVVHVHKGENSQGGIGDTTGITIVLLCCCYTLYL